MVYSHLKKGAYTSGESSFLISGDEESWEEVHRDVREIASGLRGQDIDRLYLYGLEGQAAIKALFASDLSGMEVSILDETYSQNQVRDTIKRVGEGRLLTSVEELLEFRNSNSASCEETKEGRILVMTTGTTGRPKPVRYKWETLLKQVRETESTEERWILLYPLNHFAALQVCLHVLVNRGTLVIPPAREYRPVYQAMRKHDVSSVSATPTFWRLFAGRLSPEDADELSLERITLGGEAVTEDILQRLKTLFPDATITHVYATTEIGSCFSVHDGRPGFPVEFLKRSVGNVELKIEEDELYVRSPHRMEEYAEDVDLDEHEGWIATGDLVEVVEDRVLFRGRKTESINVGGVKVYPLKVEETALQIEGVQAARAHGESNPITGEVVVLNVEPEPSADPETVKENVQKVCKQELSRYEQPRRIGVVEQLERSNEKIVRD